MGKGPLILSILSGAAITFGAVVLLTSHTPQNVERKVGDTKEIITTTPSEEDAIILFFGLINEHRIPEAVNMLTPELTENDAQKQAWGVMFNAFRSVTIKKIQLDGNSLYRVDLEVEMRPESEEAAIPYYGYEQGENVRWITLEKANDLYKIGGIATGR